MALSNLAIASVLLIIQAVDGAAITFPVYDSTDRPTEFKDGLFTYAKVTSDIGKLEQFLLCTSCTISYIFAAVADQSKIVSTQQMTFGDGLSPVQVDFVSTKLQLQADDASKTVYSWSMDIGYINPSFQKPDFFTNYKENMLGLAPMLTSDDALLRRQFLYRFIHTAPQSSIVTNESYAFNGSIQFAIGGSATDYENLVCQVKIDSEDVGNGFALKPTVQDNAMPQATNTMNFSTMLYYKDADLMLKIQNYVPPMKEELQQQVLAVNTWARETMLPKFFYDYFMKTFMIPAYTCDKLSDADTYPGMQNTYSCYCNNGDYHTMPQINLEITGKNFQYDIDPANYMFLPYLNYTVPMSLCILGIQQTTSKLPDGVEHVSLGQRAMATFPFFAIFDRTANTATFELGNPTQIGGAGALGVQIAVSVTIVLILFVMLVYLIVLRRNRIKAEEWLEQHKGTLFSHAANLKTEEEILEALVKSKELKDLLDNRNAQKTPSVRQIGGLESAGARLVEDESSEGSRRSSSSTKKLPVKTFKDEEE